MRTAATCLVILACVGRAEDRRPEPDLVGELRALVRSNGEVLETRLPDNRGIVLACGAMTYQVHNPDRTGRMQDAHAELGPRRGGVVLEIEDRPAPYGGPMALPQWLRGPYYQTHCSEVKEKGRYFFVRARFGWEFPADLRDRILERVGAAHGPPPAIAVRVAAWAAEPRTRAGEPILLKVALRNGLVRGIGFPSYAVEPADTNGETTNVDLVEVVRDGQPRNLYVARPELRIPREISGVATHRVEPTGELALRIDAAKWTITGGWIPGAYTVTVRLRNILVDGKTTLAVMSDPVRFVVE